MMSDTVFPGVCGNSALIGHIVDDIRGGTLCHAYIINGSRGIGKHSFAISVAKSVLCVRGDGILCGHCEVCRKIDGGNHTDVKLIGRGGRASIGVDVIREMRNDAYILPSEAERKVYIIEDADLMTVQAQNAFLLTLEEPPSYVLFLLLTENAKNLLETVRSRAPILNMCPATRSEISAYLNEKSPALYKKIAADKSMLDELFVCAHGNAGMAEELTCGDRLAERIKEKREALELLSLLLTHDSDVYSALEAIKKSKREQIIPFLCDMQAALRDMLLSKKTLNFETDFFTSAKAASDFGARFASRTLAVSADIIGDTTVSVSDNAAIPSALLSMAVRIRNIK